MQVILQVFFSAIETKKLESTSTLDMRALYLDNKGLLLYNQFMNFILYERF